MTSACTCTRSAAGSWGALALALAGCTASQLGAGARPNREPPAALDGADARTTDAPGLDARTTGARDAVTNGAQIIRPFRPLSGPICFGSLCDDIFPFGGGLDRVRLYMRTLSASEVAAHARRQYEPCDGKGCIAEWTFDNGAPDGSFPNTAGPALPARTVGEVLLADGPDGKYVRFMAKGKIQIENDPIVDVRNDFTLELWAIKRPCPPGFPKAPGTPCQIERLVDFSGSFSLEEHAGALNVLGGPSGAVSKWTDLYFSPVQPLNTWNHIAFVFDAPKQKFDWYRDGKLVTNTQLVKK